LPINFRTDAVPERCWHVTPASSGEPNRRTRIVSRQNWPRAAKSKMILELMKLRVNHNRSILNIDRALQSEEDVD
jgi:hypothetical protein